VCITYGECARPCQERGKKANKSDPKNSNQKTQVQVGFGGLSMTVGMKAPRPKRRFINCKQEFVIINVPPPSNPDKCKRTSKVRNLHILPRRRATRIRLTCKSDRAKAVRNNEKISSDFFEKVIRKFREERIRNFLHSTFKFSTAVAASAVKNRTNYIILHSGSAL
jgi:hypothetical protein